MTHVANDLFTELDDLRNKLSVSIRQLRKNGTEFAEAERDYKMEISRMTLKLREDGMPVGMIDKVVYGIQSVADKRFKRDIAEVIYRANLEAINSLKLQLRLVEAQISREWGNPEGA